MKVVDDVCRAFVPQEHIATVTASYNILAVRTVEVHALHCHHTAQHDHYLSADSFTFIQGGTSTYSKLHCA